jgi:hypothetical protein
MVSTERGKVQTSRRIFTFSSPVYRFLCPIFFSLGLWDTTLLAWSVFGKFILGRTVSAVRESHGIRERTRYRADIPAAVFPESEPDRAFLETGEIKSA